MSIACVALFAAFANGESLIPQGANVAPHTGRGAKFPPLPRRRDALRALEEIRVDRIARNEREWTLDEINAEISASRSDRRRRLDAGANA